MSTRIAIAEQAVKQLLEVIDDWDVKDATDPTNYDVWEQIDGDYGDPWLFGGAWYNSYQKRILYFDGTEDDEGEIEPDMVEVPERMRLALLRKFPIDYVDPDGDLEWQKRIRKENEAEIEDRVEKYREKRAKMLNDERKHTVWDIGATDSLDQWMIDDLEKVASCHGISVAEFTGHPMANQLLDMGRYFGYANIGYSDLYTKRELEEELGFSL